MVDLDGIVDVDAELVEPRLLMVGEVDLGGPRSFPLLFFPRAFGRFRARVCSFFVACCIFVPLCDSGSGWLHRGDVVRCWICVV